MSLLLHVVIDSPGVVCHEFGHHLFCRLAGVRVHKVVYFRLGNPAGYVVHGAPRHFRGQMAITVGPLVVNTVLAYALFLMLISRLPGLASLWQTMVGAAPDGARLASALQSNPFDSLLAVVCLWLGLSAALHAFPSSGDVRTLWSASGAQLKRGNLLALLGYPIAALMYLVDLLKVARLHWLYAAGLLWLSLASASLAASFLN